MMKPAQPGAVCGKNGEFRCSSCKSRVYCGSTCQTSDWKDHKGSCSGRKRSSNQKPWYDGYRKCQDGSSHEGKLEIITWDCPKEETGWGHVAIEEADDLKHKFEVEFDSDLVKFYDYWPQAFRWTCCGTDAGMDWGCDHHGTGSRRCTCDYCVSGRPLPDSIYNEQSAARMGLNLPRGPDRR